MKKYFLRRGPSASNVDYEHELNPQQYAAVMHRDGPALVLAGAGTGKTRVVTYRVARLIESGVRPENILLLTFTNKAAREMMRRAELLAGRNTSGLFGGTFHHIANLILRQHYILAGYRQGFSILDREDTKELFEACIAEIYQKDTVLPQGSVLLEICSLSKNTNRTLDEVIALRFPHFMDAVEEVTRIASQYESKKQSLNLMDFDDLLLLWKKVFAENDKIREYYSLKFKHILVDEYQDTNRLQSDIIDLATGGPQNLMVVGDDAQSIYSFRGAAFENILKFPERYQNTVIHKLTTNYRSTPEILHLANSIISRNRNQFSKELTAVLPPGGLPNSVPLKDIFQEAEFVASVLTDMNADGTAFDDIAILYRSHYQSMQLQMELQRRGIPFEIRSGLKFFEQAHVKDILSYLKVIINPFDEIGWKRVLKLVKGIGNISAGRIWDTIKKTDNPAEAIPEAGKHVPGKATEGFNRLLDVIRELKDAQYLTAPSAAIDHVLRHGYEDHLYNIYPNAEVRIEDIEQLTRFAAKYDSLEVFLSELALQGIVEPDAGGEEAPEGRVILSTVHQAKGLEWSTVFIIGMNDGKFPSAKSLKSDDEEEERRLFYVAATRAREALYICYPIVSEDWNSMGLLRPSRFISELPQDSFEEIRVEVV
ncbi:MAG: ATP-dependent DNA helicase [Thermodesulfovibrio sp.]|nr:ATP-dependent DNA helicase [Thermodesulfovibrio sp.]